MSCIAKGGLVCCVKNCNRVKRSRRFVINQKVSFHLFPKDQIVRNEWIKRVQTSYHATGGSRTEFIPKKTSVVCGLHFNSNGKKQADEILPIFIGKTVFPKSIFISDILHLDDDEATGLPVPPNIGCEVTIDLTTSHESDELNIDSTGTAFETISTANPGEDYCFDHTYSSIHEISEVKKELKLLRNKESVLKLQIHNLTQTTMHLQSENQHLKEEIKRIQLTRETGEITRSKELAFSYATVSSNLSKFKYYTGFSVTEFDVLFSYVEPDLENIKMYNNACGYTRKYDRNTGSEKKQSPGRPMALNFRDQLFITLSKLRVGLANEDLGYRVGVSSMTVSNYFTTWIDLLHKKFTEIPIWPSRALVDEYMPEEFKEKFPKTRIVLDCTEFFIETPDDFGTQSDTYSVYKGDNTAKGLLGITPNGFISFIAPLAPGRISDTELTLQSGLLELLEPQDSVMTDRGFLIKDALAEKGIHLNMPPFLNGKKQLSVEEEKTTRDIARVRKHVERVIRSVKSYRILKFVFPNTMHSSLEKIWVVCCYLVNFSAEPLLDREKKSKR